MVERSGPSGRSLLLAIMLMGNAGLQVELLLLDHAESATQWIPHVVLGVGLLSILMVYGRTTRRTLALFRIVMLAIMATGALGLFLHYRGNAEFALERTPTLGGMALLWKALRGATPTLAPGAMVQLGLLGLLYGYRHPAVTGESAER